MPWPQHRLPPLGLFRGQNKEPMGESQQQHNLPRTVAFPRPGAAKTEAERKAFLDLASALATAAAKIAANGKAIPSTVDAAPSQR
jgi:hypothetical protein